MRIHKKIRKKFNRARLPKPLTVLNQLGIFPGKTNPRGYWRFYCPFHKDGKEKNPSFNLHQADGHYLCHTCGIKGGDILAFYMHVTRKSFIEAFTDLGAWENSL